MMQVHPYISINKMTWLKIFFRKYYQISVHWLSLHLMFEKYCESSKYVNGFRAMLNLEHNMS